MTTCHDGFFVTIDGMAGAGKTTTTRLLGTYLDSLGCQVHITAEPTYGALGELARRKTDVFRGHSLACLVAADRYHHLETEIRPHLDDGEIVISDRYVASSYVLQQMDGVPQLFVDAINQDARPADLAVTLLAEPGVAASRVAARGAHDRFQNGVSTSRIESRMYREAVRQLSDHGVSTLTVDTTYRGPLDVAREIARHVTAQLPATNDRPGGTA